MGMTLRKHTHAKYQSVMLDVGGSLLYTGFM